MTTTEMGINIVWPERRWLSVEKLTMWYSDAKANDELAPHCRDARTVRDMAFALHHAGLITLSRDQVREDLKSR